jgi:hypothetical protein
MCSHLSSLVFSGCVLERLKTAAGVYNGNLFAPRSLRRCPVDKKHAVLESGFSETIAEHPAQKIEARDLREAFARIVRLVHFSPGGWREQDQTADLLSMLIVNSQRRRKRTFHSAGQRERAFLPRCPFRRLSDSARFRRSAVIGSCKTCGCQSFAPDVREALIKSIECFSGALQAAEKLGNRSKRGPSAAKAAYIFSDLRTA